MTKEQLKKGNLIAIDIKTAKDRLDAFKDLYNLRKCEKEENFSIHYTNGNAYCVIKETDEVYDILSVLIRYESEKIERLEKEFEEL